MNANLLILLLLATYIYLLLPSSHKTPKAKNEKLTHKQVFSFRKHFVDKTGIGDAVVDELDDLAIPEVKGVFFDAEKENMLNHLKLLMEKLRLSIRAWEGSLSLRSTSSSTSTSSQQQRRSAST